MAGQAVKESKSGTKVEVEGQTTPSDDTGTPDDASKVSPDVEQLIYTQTQADGLIQVAKSQDGRDWKALTDEKDGLQSKISGLETDIDENAEEVKTFEKRIDDMSSEDPARFDAVKELRAARDERRQLKTDRRDLDKRETGISDREKPVKAFERDLLVETIAEDYEDGDAKRLKDAISGFDNPSEEQIRNIAVIFFGKKKAEDKKAPAVYSGKSDGGSPYFTTTQIKDYDYWLKNKDKIQEAIESGRIRDE